MLFLNPRRHNAQFLRELISSRIGHSTCDSFSNHLFHLIEENLKNLFVSLALLLTLSLAACLVEFQPIKPVNRDPWRRTNQGWEKNTSWLVDHQPPTAANVHPGLVASLQLLASLGGMFAACPSQSPKRNTRRLGRGYPAADKSKRSVSAKTSSTTSDREGTDVSSRSRVSCTVSDGSELMSTLRLTEALSRNSE